MEGVWRKLFIVAVFTLLLINGPLSLYYLYTGVRILKYYPIELTTLLGFEATRALGLHFINVGRLIGVSALIEIAALILAIVPMRYLRALALAAVCIDLIWRLHVDLVLYGSVIASFSCMLHVMLESLAIVCGGYGLYKCFASKRTLKT